VTSPLLMLRDERKLTFIPITHDALAALKNSVPPRRLAYARSLYIALLEIANDSRGLAVAATRKSLGERAGCGPDLVSDLAPLLQEAGVVRVEERFHDNQQLAHEWVLITPPEEVPTPSAKNQDPPLGAEPRPPSATNRDPLGSQPHRSLEVKEVRQEEQRGGEETNKEEEETTEPPSSKPSAVQRAARARVVAQRLPDDFPEELVNHARVVYKVLRDVAKQHDAREVTPRGVGLAMLGHPGRRYVETAYKMASWAAAPPRPILDVVATYRSFLEKAPIHAGIERIGGPDVGDNGAVMPMVDGRPDLRAIAQALRDRGVT
jgi:hypothetical protein